MPEQVSQHSSGAPAQNSVYQVRGLNEKASVVKRRAGRHWSRSGGEWGLELLATLISFLSFAGMVAVLKYYDDRPQQSWTITHLTLNGLIAILSTITRASLLVAIASAISQSKWLWFIPAESASDSKGKPIHDFTAFDDASRGSWGSLKLLLSAKGRHVVAVGAALTILALGFDTFSQQVLSIGFQNIPNDQSTLANFIRSEQYGREHTTKAPTGAVRSTVDLPMKAAIANGILASQVDYLPVSCSTGNCTWPIVPTLGVCGACTNVTSNLTKVCSDTSVNDNNCTWSLPSGTHSTSCMACNYPKHYYLVSNQTTGDVYGGKRCNISVITDEGDFLQETLTNCSNIPKAGGSIGNNTKTWATPYNIANFEVITMPWTGDLPMPETTGAVAMECGLWMCLQAFNISVELGQTSQRIIDTWVDYVEREEEMLGGSIEFVGMPEEFNVADDARYLVSIPTLTTVQEVLTFAGNISAAYNGDPVYSSDFVLSMQPAVYDWHNWIEKIARSLSNNIRQNSRQDHIDLPFLRPDQYSSTKPNSRYAGIAYSTQPFIHVRWVWLIYPAIMLLASTAYLFVTIWQSRNNRTNPWKDNPLVLLTMTVDPHIAEKARGSSHRPDVLAQSIGDEKVVLEYDWGAWKLRSAEIQQHEVIPLVEHANSKGSG